MTSSPTPQKTASPGFYYDVALLMPVLFLVGIGITMVLSASSALALKAYGNEYYFVQRQALFAGAGIIILVAVRHFPYRLYRYLAYPILGIAIILLIAVLFSSVSFTAGGATRWLRIGTFTFQPAEPARFALIVYLAYSLARKAEKVKLFSVGVLPHLLVFGVVGGLIILQPDFGSVVILGAVTGILLFIGGTRLTHLAICAFSVLPFLIWVMMHAEYRIKRLLSFMDPWQYASREGYQIIHSQMAFGTGGLAGTGIGKGYQKLFYLPEPHTDFIFSVIGEETGFVGVTILLLAYGVLLWRGFWIAKNCKEPFGCYLASGLSAVLGLQVCINMGVTLGLLPTKGLTLPFISYGGTSLLISMVFVGVLLNISAANRGKR